MTKYQKKQWEDKQRLQMAKDKKMQTKDDSEEEEVGWLYEGGQPSLAYRLHSVIAFDGESYVAHVKKSNGQHSWWYSSDGPTRHNSLKSMLDSIQCV